MSERDETIELHERDKPRTVIIEGRSETELERYDRNLSELLIELRVALPGVQVLFAFLLVAPFNQRFGTVSDFERKLYFATLLCTLLASILLIAPTVVHRLQFARGHEKSVVYTATRLTIAGLTSRNALLPLRRALARRRPELIKSNGGGSNAILVHGEITEHAALRLRTWPERRVAQLVRLADGRTLVNYHASRGPERAREELERLYRHALGW